MRSSTVFIVTSAILFCALIGSYAFGLLPHYTIVVDGNTLTFVRDDPKHLAEQAELAQESLKSAPEFPKFAKTQPAGRESEVDVELLSESKAAEVDAVDVQQTTTPNKCVDPAKRVTYQFEPCKSTGLVLAK